MEFDPHLNYRNVKECGIERNKAGHVLINAGDMIDAIYFIFPKDLLEHLVYAKLEGKEGMQWDLITKKNILVIHELVENDETYVVVHPKFWRSDG